MSSSKKVLFHQAERVDLPDIKKMSDYTEDSMQALNKSFMSGDLSAYITKGFVPSDAGGLNISVTVADSSFFNSKVSESNELSGSYFVGDSTETALTTALTAGVINYVHLKLTRVGETPSVRVFWDKTAVVDGVVSGASHQQAVNTVQGIEVELYITTSSLAYDEELFSADSEYIPIARIKTDSSSITDIEDRRNMFFRLGKGHPYNPWYLKTLSSLTESQDDFGSGDKEITNLKDLLDLIMSEIKDMKFGGSAAKWYEPAPSSLLDGLDHLSDGGTWTWSLYPDISAYLIGPGENATIVTPAVTFLTSGTANATFTVASDAGLSVDQLIEIDSVTQPALSCKIVDISGVGPYTITVEAPSLTFDADANILIANTSFINNIDFTVDSPITIYDNQVAYVDLDRTQNAVVSPVIEDADNFDPAVGRMMIVRREGDSVYIGQAPLQLTHTAGVAPVFNTLSINVAGVVDYIGSPNGADTTPDYNTLITSYGGARSWFASDGGSLTEAVAKLDYYGLQLHKHTGADHTPQLVFSDCFSDPSHDHSDAANGGAALGPLTGLTIANNVDVGNFQIRALNFRSDVPTGTAPLVVASTTKCTNLNADYLDGYTTGNGSGNIPISNGTKCTNLNADKLDGYSTGNGPGYIPISNGTKCTGLNADKLDGYHSSSFAQLTHHHSLTHTTAYKSVYANGTTTSTSVDLVVSGSASNYEPVWGIASVQWDEGWFGDSGNRFGVGGPLSSAGGLFFNTYPTSSGSRWRFYYMLSATADKAVMSFMYGAIDKYI